jgi:hypothetical protein
MINGCTVPRIMQGNGRKRCLHQRFNLIKTSTQVRTDVIPFVLTRCDGLRTVKSLSDMSCIMITTHVVGTTCKAHIYVAGDSRYEEVLASRINRYNVKYVISNFTL